MEMIFFFSNDSIEAYGKTQKSVDVTIVDLPCKKKKRKRKKREKKWVLIGSTHHIIYIDSPFYCSFFFFSFLSGLS